MRTSISLTLYALLFAAAEAGPLNIPDRREAAVKKWARDGAGKDSASGESGSGAFSTVVTFVPGEALKGSATGAAPPVVSSFLSSGSVVVPTRTTVGGPGKPSEDAANASDAPAKATGSPNSKIPTVVTDIPSPTGTISPDVLQSNLDTAKQFNADFATLTPESSCLANQAACITGKTALCGPAGAFVLTACPSGQSCFALPMDTTAGVQLKCVDKSTAERILGALPAGEAPIDPVPGEFTKTATISATNGAVTVTMTVRPEAPSAAPTASEGPDVTSKTTITRTLTTTTAPAESSSLTTAAPSSSSTQDTLEVIPIPSTTTITTTIRPPANPTGRPRGGGPPQGPPNQDENPKQSEPPRTRTRSRRPQPEPTATGGNGNGEEAAKPTQAPGGGGNPKGPSEDTRVTFTLIETTTVTEKETVTVTAGGSTVTARVAVRMV
ncbi:hypothetical protein QBC34DRAFT_123013 [Podospora aff. communis PSN243]|uniref:Carbohydrate-binding module family 19 domain-containing protein n=1 Tax=Podospora aff. communis PSN243 TaxID=3040156 RepID=A0AAV9GI31_9PEZI|nr:hypothetical protein QBC34DRAFT_123013 [Podospora aff. communis PSN243]